MDQVTDLYSLVVAVLPQQQLHVLTRTEERVHPKDLAVRSLDLPSQSLNLNRVYNGRKTACHENTRTLNV